jgi:hypothetical protein
MKLAVVALGTKQRPLPSAHKPRPRRRRSAAYDDCIFKGAKPADLPAQASVKFEFVINRKTSQALGLDVPPTLLKLADEVINDACASCAAVCIRQDAGSGFVRRTRRHDYRTIA